MKRANVSLILTAVAVLPFSSCAISGSMTLVGSGTPATREFDVRGFKTVEANGAYNVVIKRGSDYALSITTDDNIIEFVRVSVEGDKLILRVDQDGRPLGIRPKVGLKAALTMPTLDGVTLHGASTATAEGFEHIKTFKAELSGASTLNGDLSADDVDITADGASRVALKGSAKKALLQASGSSGFHLGDFKMAEATVRLSGASNGIVAVKDKLNYDLNGASRLVYHGQPTIGEKEVSGASSVTAQ
jgi:hypothetical protein